MTMPTGKLAWGQAGSYDAIDDRAVIAAVTRNRVGLVWPTTVAAGAGLAIIIRGGWLGVASCADRTSGVVGSREDQTVMATPGPGTGSRQDVVWCDTDPDEGTWSLRVIPRTATTGLSGIPLCWITAPAGSNLASQMTLEPVNATLERRLTGFSSVGNDQSNHTAGSWAAATGNNLSVQPSDLEPGQWYRIRAVANGFMMASGASREGRIGLGWRLSSQPVGSSSMVQAAAVRFVNVQNATFATVEWIYRHPITSEAISRIFDTRCWIVGTGTFTPGALFGEGYSRQLTVEDLGS